MYYCPCPCSDPIDPDAPEENSFISLPRNLSYVQESYLDAHSVSGRFVHNPHTERLIAASNTNATLRAAADAATLHANESLSLNGDDNHYHHHPPYLDHYSHTGNISNGGVSENSTTATFPTTTTYSSPITTTDRWRADGTKVEIEFGKGTTITGREYSSDFESSQEATKRSVNIRNKGEGERGDSIEGVKIDYDDDNEHISNILSLVKSRRDPTVYPGSSVCKVISSDCTKSSVVQDQSQKGKELCDLGKDKNSSSSASATVCDADLVLVYPTVTASSPTTTLSSSSSSKSNVNSTSLPSSSSSSSSSSKTSFISRVTALLSPKDEVTKVNPAHHTLDLGSSVDAEPTPYDPDRDPDIPDPSQPLLLRSPDRSGLIMDRGEDLILTPSSDHDDPESSIICTSNNSVTNAIPKSYGPDSFPDGGQSIDSNVSGAHSDEEEVIVIEYSDPNEDDLSKLTKTINVNTHNSPVSPPETYNDTLGSSDFGVVISENETQLITTKIDTMVPSESPPDVDSDAFSEEGVFVNMIDDTDAMMERCVSEVSDDTSFSVDSMFCSPDYIEPGEEQVTTSPETNENSEDGENKAPRRMTLEEAISKAASDFNKMTMLLYPNERAAPELNNEDLKSDLDKPSTSKSWDRSERLKALSRGSPAHGIPALNVQISSTTSGSSSSDFEVSENQRPTRPKESPIYEDNEFNFNRQTLRKSSSLKTNKTPPGTPHRKKVVRFADAMGLDLESVRHVLNMESPPKIPASAMADLKQGLNEDRVAVGSRFLSACFTQPGATNNFVKSVISQKVRLENAIITDLTITGFIRVANVAFHKSVRVRYTHNNWATFHDIAASYIKGSCDGPTDRFSFSIVAPAHFIPGNKLEFAVSYNAEGTEFWDNNGGLNYVFECFAKTVPTENDREWLHFL